MPNAERKLLNNRKGFSLIEVMFACVVLTVGILAMISLMVSNISHSMGARDQIIASELAQEGIELVRNVRDNNFAADKKAFAADFANDDKDNCRIDKDSTDVADCNNGQNRKKLFLENGYYVHSDGAGDETKFQRKILIVYDTGRANDATSATISSMVSWGSDLHANCNACGVSNKCVCVSGVLTDWH